MNEWTSRLLADTMLGRLAKWLRLMGYDTLYASALSDHQIVSRSRGEGRLVLTCDRELAQRRGIWCLLVQGSALEDQIAEVVSACGIPPAGVEPRCSQCNTSLRAALPAQARVHVPAHVAETHRQFRHCSHCDKYYWSGSHWKSVQLLIARYSAAPM